MPAVKTENEVRLQRELLDTQAKLLRANAAVPVVIILSPLDPIGQTEEAAAALAAIALNNENLLKDDGVRRQRFEPIQLTTVDAVEGFAHRVEESEIPPPALVHVISHADDTSAEFKIGKGLAVETLARLVGPCTHFLLSVCNGMNLKGEWLHNNTNAASVLSYKTTIWSQDAIPIAREVYRCLCDDWRQPIATAVKSAEGLKGRKLLKETGKRKQVQLRRSLPFEDAVWAVSRDERFFRALAEQRRTTMGAPPSTTTSVL